MTSRHLTPGDLLDLHFGEAEGRRREELAAHAAECRRCREELAGVEWVDRTLAALPEEPPPPDGLARLVDRLGHESPTPVRPAAWARPLATTLAGVAGGAGAIYAVGTWLGASANAQPPLLGSAAALSGFGLAALVFFGVGSFVTLALAPALLMEAQTRARTPAAR